jgi:hypothetical protein
MVRHKAEAGTPPRWHQFEPYHFALDNMTAKSYWIRGRLNSDYWNLDQVFFVSNLF